MVKVIAKASAFYLVTSTVTDSWPERFESKYHLMKENIWYVELNGTKISFCCYCEYAQIGVQNTRRKCNLIPKLPLQP
jgi:hypothetical protein